MEKKDLDLIAKTSFSFAQIELDLKELSIESLTKIKQTIEKLIEQKRFTKVVQDFENQITPFTP